MKPVIYAGSFDPLTNGHIWVINEALKLFGYVWIVLANNPNKKYYFSIEERKNIIEEIFKGKNVKIIVLEQEYVAKFAEDNDVHCLVRGLRNSQDFDFEKTVQTLNQLVVSDIKTVYLLPPAQYSEISSSNVKSMVGFPGWLMAVESLIPSVVASMFQKKIYESKLKPYWDKLGIDDSDSWENLLTAYSSEGRFYHSLEHLDELFSKLTTLGVGNVSNELILSIFFHDYTYNPKAHDNEEQSVNIFKAFATKNKISPTTIDTVTEFILATKSHQNTLANAELDLFLDLDLSILGASQARFNRYEKEIRREYSFVPEEIYKPERARIMKRLASSQFKTTSANALWEENKKNNLKNY